MTSPGSTVLPLRASNAALAPRRPSETERATRASEARFRIAAPNSATREMRIFGLGPESRAIAREAAAACGGGRVQVWEGGLDHSAPGALLAPPDDAAASDAWLADLAGVPAVLGRWLAGANTVIVVAAVGESTAAVPLIAKLVQPSGALVTGLIVERANASQGDVQTTVTALRAYCSMLVHTADSDYVVDMLTALGA